MENAKIGLSSENLLKIELNSLGDCIVISADNTMFFDGFAAGYKRIVNLADDVPVKMSEIEKKYDNRKDFSSVMDMAVEMSKVNVDFSQNAIGIIDNIFGEGTVKKYFRILYDKIPNFLPDSDCIIDFFEQITPVVEALYGRKIERQKEASKARMSKYKPQDHMTEGHR